MGKIRVKTIGDEEAEKKQVQEAKKRAEAKKADKAAAPAEEEQVASPVEQAGDKPKKEKKAKFQKKGSSRSKSYQEKAELVTDDKVYSLSEAVKLLPSLKRAAFDETVELHFTTTETGISGSVTLPNGTGKKTRVVIANGQDAPAIETLIKKIEAGTIDFDILIATPDAMPKLAKVARVLGPRGLMPNPKNGTVTPKPEEVAKKYEGGQINYKTEAKFPLLHIAVGKVSFGEDKITENITTVLASLDKKKLKNATLKSTMSPAIRFDVAA